MVQSRKSNFFGKLQETGFYVNFFANFLGIVLGILLTFGVNELWQRHEEKGKTKEVLILVRNELETNKQWFKDQEAQINRDSYVFKKILEADKKWSTIPKDSLVAYYKQISTFSSSELNTSAWHIFQNSEMIQKIPDKELVIDLASCYFYINTCYDMIMKNYWDSRMKIIPHELIMNDFLNELINKKESFYFISVISEGTGFQELFFNIDAIIDYTISVLDKYGDFRYNSDEGSKEYESFMKARTDSLLHKNDTIVDSKNN